jgi:hypothetical protein
MMSQLPSLPMNLTRLACRSVASVLGSYGLTVQEPFQASPAAATIAALAKEAGLEPPSVGASIAFSGPKIRGELLLAGTFDLVAGIRPEVTWSSPAARSAASHLVVRDWAAELANQVLGHLKNRLSGMDVAFVIATPTPLSGPALSAQLPKSAGVRPVLFRAEGGGIWFWLDVVCDPDIDLRVAASERTKEGELILFPAGKGS